MNATAHAGVRAKISDRVRPRPAATLRNRVYLTLTFGEGDNIQYCQRRMRDLWDDPERGDVPVNWTVSPLLADIGPALLAYYRRTATANDLLISGPSGAGYTYPGSWCRRRTWTPTPGSADASSATPASTCWPARPVSP
jgi:hypothetical protein